MLQTGDDHFPNGRTIVNLVVTICRFPVHRLGLGDKTIGSFPPFLCSSLPTTLSTSCHPALELPEAGDSLSFAVAEITDARLVVLPPKDFQQGATGTLDEPSNLGVGCPQQGGDLVMSTMAATSATLEVIQADTARLPTHRAHARNGRFRVLVLGFGSQLPPFMLVNGTHAHKIVLGWARFSSGYWGFL